MKTLPHWLAVLAFLLLPFAASAQQQGLEIDIVGGNASALPIAVVPMPYQGGARRAGDRCRRRGARRPGAFRRFPRACPRPASPSVPTRGGEVQYPTWRALKQDYLVVGRVVDAGDGSYRVEYELFDVAKQERLLGLALTARSNAMRDVAHQMADAIYEKILGVRGAFWTRIAYITQTGTRQAGALRADGRRLGRLQPADRGALGRAAAVAVVEPGRQQAGLRQLRARQLLDLHPGHRHRRARAGRQLPRHQRRADVLAGRPPPGADPVAQRQPRDLRDGPGQQAADPAHQPVRHRYRADLERGRRQHLLHLRPRRPPADLPRGRPAAAAPRGSPSRATTTPPPPCPTTARRSPWRRAAATTTASRCWTAAWVRPRWSTLSPGSLDESPSFAPNASMVLYAAREGRRGVLYAVSADARVRQRLVLADGDVREPAWSPYRSPR